MKQVVPSFHFECSTYGKRLPCGISDHNRCSPLGKHGLLMGKVLTKVSGTLSQWNKFSFEAKQFHFNVPFFMVLSASHYPASQAMFNLKIFTSDIKTGLELKSVNEHSWLNCQTNS